MSDKGNYFRCINLAVWEDVGWYVSTDLFGFDVGWFNTVVVDNVGKSQDGGGVQGFFALNLFNQLLKVGRTYLFLYLPNLLKAILNEKHNILVRNTLCCISETMISKYENKNKL